MRIENKTYGKKISNSNLFFFELISFRNDLSFQSSKFSLFFDQINKKGKKKKERKKKKIPSFQGHPF